MNRRFSPRCGQSGVVLFMALIVLVIMSLVGLAMIRQITSTQVVAGNLAFKEGAVAISDLAVEEARRVIRDVDAIDLTIDWTAQSANAEAAGYFAQAPWEFGVTGAVAFDMFDDANWQNDNSRRVASASSATQENEVRYVIHRLCRTTGLLDTNQCSLRLTTVGGSKGGTSYTDPSLPLTQQPYYRVTTRVVGPRNTVSYTQVILY